MVDASLQHCSGCREALPPVAATVFRPRGPVSGTREIRRGLLFMWLAAVLYYFAAGYSFPIKFPIPYAPILTQYVLPFSFLAGLGLVTYGLYLRSKRDSGQ